MSTFEITTSSGSSEFVLNLVGRARLRCAAEHESPWLGGLQVFWRAHPGRDLARAFAPFALGRTDANGYLLPMLGSEEGPFAALMMPGALYEAYLVRHPDPMVVQKIMRDPLFQGDAASILKTKFGEPLLLKPELAPTDPKAAKAAKGKKGAAPVREVVLKIPEDPRSYHPRGPAAYGGWHLYRDMPNGCCAPVRDAVARLQHQLGALRYPIGGSSCPYVPEPQPATMKAYEAELEALKKAKKPVPAKALFAKEYPNEGTFDILTWSSVLAFQRDAKEGRALHCPKRPHDTVLRNLRSAGVEGWNRAESYRIAHAYAETAPAPAGSARHPAVTANGVVDEATAKAIEAWVKAALRRPGALLVPIEATPGRSDWLLWIRHDALAPYQGWVQEAKRLGFAQGVALNHTYRDARVDALGAGYGRSKLSIHKTGYAFDLRMRRFHFTLADDFDVWFVREGLAGRTKWRVYGRAKKTAALAAEPTLFKDQIAPWDYDALSPQGGREAPCPELKPGETFIDLTAVGQRYGFLPIHSFAAGWYGVNESTVTIDGAASFEAAVKKLQTWVKQYEASIRQRGRAVEQLQMIEANEQAAKKRWLGFNGDEAAWDRDEAARRLEALDVTREEAVGLTDDAAFLGTWLELFKARKPSPDVVVTKKGDLDGVRRALRAKFAGREIAVFPGESASGEPQRITVDEALALPAVPFVLRPLPKHLDVSPGASVAFPRLFGEAIGMEWWHFQMTGLLKGKTWLSLLEDLGWTREGLGDADNPGPFGMTGLGYTKEDLAAFADGTKPKVEKKPAPKADSKAAPKNADGKKPAVPKNTTSTAAPAAAAGKAPAKAPVKAAPAVAAR